MSSDEPSMTPSQEPEDDTPELVNPSLLPPNYAQKIETDILDPVVINDDFIRFTLPKKGFLSHQSKITFAIEGQNNNKSAYFPLNIGVNSVIQRAVLKAGNRTICETDDWNYLQCYRSLFLTPENNKERERFLTQRMLSRQPEYDNTTATNTNAPTYAIDTGVYIDEASGDYAMPLYSTMSNEARKPSPVYSIFLGDLFDIFNGNNLPLYMLTDEITIELYTSESANKRTWIGSGGANDHNFRLEQSQVKMVYDTIYYDGETMEKYRQRVNRTGLTMSYVDYRLTRRTGPVNTFSSIVQNLGGAGRLVDKVILGLTDSSQTGAQNEIVILNNYVAIANGQVGAPLTLNIRYNDRDEFTRDLDNPAVQLNESRVAEQGAPMYVTTSEYSSILQPTSITSNNIETRDTRTGLQGSLVWNSFRLKRGERVNNQGIDLVYKTGIVGVDAHELKVWLALRKVARIENGLLTCYFA